MAGQNTLVNYGRIENTSQHRPLYMAMMDGGSTSSVVFVPSGRHVLVINLFTGEMLHQFSEHFSDVRCCEYNPYTQVRCVFHALFKELVVFDLPI